MEVTTRDSLGETPTGGSKKSVLLCSACGYKEKVGLDLGKANLTCPECQFNLRIKEDLQMGEKLQRLNDVIEEVEAMAYNPTDDVEMLKDVLNRNMDVEVAITDAIFAPSNFHEDDELTIVTDPVLKNDLPEVAKAELADIFGVGASDVRIMDGALNIKMPESINEWKLGKKIRKKVKGKWKVIQQRILDAAEKMKFSKAAKKRAAKETAGDKQKRLAKAQKTKEKYA